MKYNKKWESLAWIVVWIFILTIVMLWIWNLIWNSRDLIKSNNLEIINTQLKNNSKVILENIDISWIADWEVFYIYKNILSKNYEIKIWSSNSKYKYIDKYWFYIENNEEYNWNIFSREFEIKNINILWKNKNIYKTKIKIFIKQK